jgi:hypothetical protein
VFKGRIFKEKWQICDGSQSVFENPSVNVNSLSDSETKIACCSSELIFRFIYAGSSIQTGEQPICLVYRTSFMELRSSSNNTTPHLQKKKKKKKELGLVILMAVSR